MSCSQCMDTGQVQELTCHYLQVEQAGAPPNGVGGRALVQARRGGADVAQRHCPLHLIWGENLRFNIKIWKNLNCALTSAQVTFFYVIIFTPNILAVPVLWGLFAVFKSIINKQTFYNESCSVFKKSWNRPEILKWIIHIILQMTQKTVTPKILRFLLYIYHLTTFNVNIKNISYSQRIVKTVLFLIYKTFFRHLNYI